MAGDRFVVLLPLVVFKGSTSKGRGKRRRKEGERKKR